MAITGEPQAAAGRSSAAARVRPRAAAVLVLLLAAVASGACGGPTGPSWVDRARASGPAPASGGDDVAAGQGCALVPDASTDAGGATPGSGGTSGSSTTPGARNDPYTATGARQVPGPDMALAPLPSGPAGVVVARPADPDEHVAARQPDGKVSGPVPAPKIIGQAGSRGASAPPPVDASGGPTQLCEGGGL